MSASQSQRIVVGVDGSPSSIKALQWALAQATLTGGTIDAVCAWHYPSSFGVPAPDSTDYRALSEETLAKAITAARSVDPDYAAVAVRPIVIKAPPPRALLERAQHASLLVVGFRGHSGFTEALLGSVTQHLAHHAPCALVIIRDGA